MPRRGATEARAELDRIVKRLEDITAVDNELKVIARKLQEASTVESPRERTGRIAIIMETADGLLDRRKELRAEQA